jgi:hypothetical protein
MLVITYLKSMILDLQIYKQAYGLLSLDSLIFKKRNSNVHLFSS